MIWHEDEPLAHPSSVALYFVSQLASQHVKVVLTGEGSDELLAGYARYREDDLQSRVWGAISTSSDAGVARDTIRKQIERMPHGSKRATEAYADVSWR